MLSRLNAVPVLLALILFQSAVALELQRFNVVDGFTEVPSDLGEYEFFTCSGSGSDRTCEFNMDELISYFGGLGFYATLNIGLMILVLLLVMCNALIKCCHCVYNCCTCCWKKKSDQIAPNGEGEIPPPLQPPEMEKPIDPDHEDLVIDELTGKPKLRDLPSRPALYFSGQFSRFDLWRIMSLTCVIILIPLFYILGASLGNIKFTENSPGLVNAPAGFQQVVINVEPVLTNTLMTMVSRLIVPTLLSLNSTFHQAVNIEELVDGFRAVNASMEGWPQVQRVLDIGFEFANITTEGSIPIVNSLIGSFTAINDTVNEIVDINNNLTNFVNEIDSNNQALIVDLEATNTSVHNLRSTVVDLLGDGGSNTGLIPSISNDLGTIPSSSTFTTAGTGQQSIVDGSYAGDSSSISTHVTELQSVRSTINGLPNYDTTASNLVSINNSMNAIAADGGLLDQVVTNINNITAQIALYPSFPTITNHLELLDSVVRAIDIVPIVNSLDQLLEVFSVVPDLIAQIRIEVLHLRNLTSIVDSALSITDQVFSVNESIIEVPSNVMDSVIDFRQNYSNTTELLEDLEDIVKQIDDATRNITDYLDDAREYVDDAAEFNTTLADALESYNITDFVSSLNKATANLDSIDFTDSTNMISAIRTDIGSFSIDYSFTVALNGLQDYFDSLETYLKRVVDASAGGAASNVAGDYIQLARGYCTDDDTVICDSDSDCTAGTCTGKGTYRCEGKGTVSCTSDSDCSSHCLTDSTTGATLLGLLTGYSSVALDSDELSNALSDLGAFDSTVSQLDAAISSIESGIDATGQFNATEAADLIKEINDGITKFTVDTYVETLEDVRDSLEDLNLEEDLDPYDDFGRHQRRMNREFSDFILDLIDAQHFVLDPQHFGQHLANVGYDNLKSRYESDGPSAMMGYVFGQLDEMNAYFREHMRTWELKESHIQENNEDGFEFLDKMGGYHQTGYGDMRENGAVYYFLRLFGAKTVHADDETSSGIVTDNTGEEYSGNKLCWTASCEEHTVTVINTEPSNTWSSEFPDMEGGIGYSREGVYNMLWVLPMLTVFYAVWVLLFGYWCHSEKIRRGCTFLFQSSVLCQIPFALLFTSILFMLAMVFHDMCESGSGVGHSYLVTYGDEMCTESLNGIGTLRDCVIEFEVPAHSRNVTLHLDILGMYDGLIGGECGSHDPFASIVNSMADQLRDIPTDDMIDWLNKNSTKDIGLRPPVKNIMTEAANNSGLLLYTFLTDLSNLVLNCERLSAISIEMSGATCGSLAAPMLWMVGAWYLAAWVFVFCAFPAGCLKNRYTRHHHKVMTAPAQDEYGHAVEFRDRYADNAGPHDHAHVNKPTSRDISPRPDPNDRFPSEISPRQERSPREISPRVHRDHEHGAADASGSGDNLAKESPDDVLL